MSSSILLNVLDIYLDTENPRHDPIYEQSDIIEHLLADERVKNLAKHISIHGINPLDSIGVVKDEEDNYLVVEGNRRLCALLLLNDPEKAPSGEISYFKRLAENSSKIPSSINCVLFDDTDEANIWMGVRHNGDQDGVGIRSWDSQQKTRYNGRVNKKDQNALALALIDYAVSKGILHAEKTEKIITTAARYLGNPFIRDTFGIASPRSEKNVKINVSCVDFDIILNRFCQDLVSNTVVNSRTRKDDWMAYGRKLIEEGFAPVKRVEPHLLEECLIDIVNKSSEESDSDSSASSSNEDDTTNTSSNVADENQDNEPTEDSKNRNKNHRGNKNPDSRKYIIPTEFRPIINNKILRRAFEELKNIEVDDHPLAVALVTRAFLENLYILFHEKVTGSYQAQQTHILMEKVIKEIELDSSLTRAEKNALAALKRVKANDLNVLSPKTLGANAHAGIYPDPRQLKREFDNIHHILNYMLKRA